MPVLQLPELNYVPLVLDETKEKLFIMEFASQQYNIFLSNGYVARTLKEQYNESLFYGKIEFLHRWLMKDELKKVPEHLKKTTHIHHKDGNKLNNKKENLCIIQEDVHFQHHEREKYTKAYRTWCRKVYGDFWSGDYYEEFQEWLDKKRQE